MGLFSSLFGRRPAAFKQAFEAALRSTGDRRALCWAAGDELKVVLVDRWPTTGPSLELDPVFQQWSQGGDAAVLAAALATVAKSGATSQRGVHPILSGPSFALGVRQGGETPVEKPIVPGLSGLMLFADGPAQGGMVTQAELANMGRTADELWSEALQPFAGTPFLEMAPRAWVVRAPAVLAWERQTPPAVCGEPLLVALAADRAVFTGTQDEEGLELVAHLIKQYLEAGDPLLGWALVRRGDRWERWLPPRSMQAVRLFFVMMRRCSLRDEYQAQKKILEQTRTEFVATFRAEGEGALVATSVAAWGKGITTLLPRSEYLLLGTLGGQSRVLRFETALARLGAHLEPVEGLWPPRWLVDSYPTAEELEALPQEPPDPSAGDWFEDDSESRRVEVAPAWGEVGRDEFAREALRLIDELGAKGGEYVDAEFALSLPVGPQQRPAGAPADAQMRYQIRLGNPYERCRHLPPDARRATLGEYLGLALDSLRAPQVAEPGRVLPLLRPVSERWQWALHLKLQCAGAEVVPDPQVQRAFTDDIWICFAIDAEKSIRVMSQSELRTLGLGEDPLFELAMQNLSSRSSRPLERVAEGVYSSPYLDDYDATRLLLPQLLAGLELKGRPVAFVPDRSTLVVTGDEDEKGLVEAYARVRLAEKGDARPVCRLPLSLCEQRWTPWLPKVTSVARPMLKKLAMEHTQRELEYGRALLAKLWPKSRLADMAARPTDGVRCEVAAILPQETEAPVLLPRAEVVVTTDGRQLGWEEFQRAHARALAAIEGTEGRWWHLAPGE
jgi:hypothetical protein